MTSQPFDIVIFPPSPWLLVRSLPEHTIFELIRRGHRILVVEPLNTISAFFRNQSWMKVRADAKWGLRKISDSLWVYRPPPLGIPGASRSVVAARLSADLLARLAARAARLIGFDRYVAWTYQYNSGPTLKTLNADFSLYECGDNDVALARTPAQRQTLQRMEQGTCSAADLVICCTDELCDERIKYNRHTHPVYCAADGEFFATALSEATVVPADIAALPKPVIGYMGGMDPWKIDIELVAGIARMRPDWSLVFVGYVWFGFDRSVFAGLKNVHILGPRPYEMFPGYLKGMDVALMPFPLNDITRYGDALKCYEYLAAGLGVVSRPVPVALRLEDMVHLASTPAEFVAAIGTALAGDRSAALARSHAILSAHTWRHRVQQKLDLIARYWNPARRGVVESAR